MEGGADEVVEVNCVGGGDPGAYAGMLKRKLDLYCAAVAKSMGDGPIRVTNSNAIDDTVVQGKPANSGTSKEQSDDDGDLEENTDPTNTKRMRRVLSNRESARRSRKRKQAHLNDLESQVTQLRAENASFLKRLTDMTQKYKEATLDNRNLTVDVETMRRKISDFLMGTSETRLDMASSTTTTSACHPKLHSQHEVTMGADLIKQTKEMLHVAKKVDGEDSQRERRQCLLLAENKARQGRHAVREEKAPGLKAMHGRASMHPCRAVTKWSRGEPRWKPGARHEKFGWFAAQEVWCKEQRKERLDFYVRLLWILF